MSANDAQLIPLDADLRAMVHSELMPQESVLWSGQPNFKRYMMQALPILIFAIVWNAMAYYFFFAVSLGHAAGNIARKFTNGMVLVESW